MHINWFKIQICSLGCMLGPMQEMGMNVKHNATVTRPQTLRYLVLNSSKCKTRLKFMKVGMLSWSGINMPWDKFCPIWGRFGYMLLTTSMMVSVVYVPPLWTKRFHCLLLLSKFSSVNIEQQECCVNFGDFSVFVWIFLCINCVFDAFMCIILGNEFQTPGTVDC